MNVHEPYNDPALGPREVWGGAGGDGDVFRDDA
jgi:hypothetical protein